MNEICLNISRQMQYNIRSVQSGRCLLLCDRILGFLLYGYK